MYRFRKLACISLCVMMMVPAIADARNGHRRGGRNSHRHGHHRDGYHGGHRGGHRHGGSWQNPRRLRNIAIKMDRRAQRFLAEVRRDTYGGYRNGYGRRFSGSQGRRVFAAASELAQRARSFRNHVETWWSSPATTHGEYLQLRWAYNEVRDEMTRAGVSHRVYDDFWSVSKAMDRLDYYYNNHGVWHSGYSYSGWDDATTAGAVIGAGIGGLIGLID